MARVSLNRVTRVGDVNNVYVSTLPAQLRVYALAYAIKLQAVGVLAVLGRRKDLPEMLAHLIENLLWG